MQNLLFYRHFDLLHVYHPDLYHLAAALSKSFQVPWLAGHLSGEDHGGGDHADLTFLREADAVTCSCSAALQTLQPFFHPYRKTPLLLLPQVVKTGPPPGFSTPQQRSILYAGPLENNHLPPFQALNQVVQRMGTWTCGVCSGRNLPASVAIFTPGHLLSVRSLRIIRSSPAMVISFSRPSPRVKLPCSLKKGTPASFSLFPARNQSLPGGRNSRQKKPAQQKIQTTPANCSTGICRCSAPTKLQEKSSSKTAGAIHVKIMTWRSSPKRSGAFTAACSPKQRAKERIAGQMQAGQVGRGKTKPLMSPALSMLPSMKVVKSHG